MFDLASIIAQPGILNIGLAAPGRPMDLRDWFAGQALVGFLADGSQRHINSHCEQVPGFLEKSTDERAAIVNEQIAAGVYELADAMLTHREKNDV